MTDISRELLLDLRAGVARNDVVHFLRGSKPETVRVLVHDSVAGQALRNSWGDAVEIIQSRWTAAQINRFDRSIAAIPDANVISQQGGVNFHDMQPYVALTVRHETNEVMRVRRDVPDAYLTVAVAKDA